DEERPLALKVLHPNFREVATPYFMREYSIQRTLRHPSIARALDLGFDLQGGEEVPYFAMPFVPGVPLTSLLDTHPPIEQIVRWSIDVLEALDAIHRAGFLHRDVKPGNILVDPRAESGTAARLIDFGIAVALTAEPEDFFIGTPEFSAPERIECLRPFDVRSDLYAVGLIMHELIEGGAPWPGRDPEELMHARRETPPKPITRPCPDGVRALIADLLAPDPQRRPASAAAVIERLQVLGAALEPHSAYGGIESVEAFAMRLSSLPIPAPSYARALSTEAPVLVIHVPPGHDGGELLDELGDRRALSGVRVVRLKLEGKSKRPLGELQGALDVLRRLRERNEPKVSSETALRGLAGAAVLLTRLHRKTLLVIDGLDQADEATLMVLGQSFLGAQNRELEVVATMSTTASPKAPAAIDAFLSQEFVKQVTLEPLTVAETGAFVARALGPGLLDPEVVESLHQSAHGRPLEVSRLLVEAFKKGILIRRPDGYLWLQSDERRDEEPSGLLVVDLERELAERMSLLIAPLPEAVVERFLGDAVGYRRMLATEVLRRDESGQVVAAQRDACAWRYTSLEPGRRSELHLELAGVLARCGEPGVALLVAEQLVLTLRP
ncbi:MAG TPA: serine/threonine-protein kinase, partial [Myxococcota bacterium]|nr:serine/threonine-protein kinase [Myxococcota bacterium]